MQKSESIEKPMAMKKTDGFAENEVVADNYQDPEGACIKVTQYSQMAPQASRAFVLGIQEQIHAAHKMTGMGIKNTGAEPFEEGWVLDVAPPYANYGAALWLMDFYDVMKKGLCSRMHFHVGERMTIITTGPDSLVLISSFSPILFGEAPGKYIVKEVACEDGLKRPHYTYIQQPNTKLVVQVPRGCTHQFNCVVKNEGLELKVRDLSAEELEQLPVEIINPNGLGAVVESAHVEEKDEGLREGRVDEKGEHVVHGMNARTIFLGSKKSHCNFQYSGGLLDLYKEAIKETWQREKVIGKESDKAVIVGKLPPLVTSIAASVAIFASAVFGVIMGSEGSNAERDESMKNFFRKPRVELILDGKMEEPLNPAEAYGGAEPLAKKPALTAVIPQAVYDVMRISPDKNKDPKYVAAKLGLNLRTNDGIVSARQEIFSYQVNTPNSDFMHHVTTDNFAQEMARLSDTVSKASSIRKSGQQIN